MYIITKNEKNKVKTAYLIDVKQISAQHVTALSSLLPNSFFNHFPFFFVDGNTPPRRSMPSNADKWSQKAMALELEQVITTN